MRHAYIEKLCTERTPVRLFTTNGFLMTGVILEHDADMILMLCDGVKKLIFVHAISTIELAKNKS